MKYILKKYLSVPFVLKMTLGFLLGITAGLLFKTDTEILKPLGTLLLHLLSLIAIPIIFLTVVLAVNQMSASQLGRMGWKLILYYAATTAAAIIIGLVLAYLLHPGNKLELPNVQVEKPETPGFSDVLLKIVPENIFQAFSSGDVLAITFVAIILGIGISTMKFSKDEKLTEYGMLLEKLFAASNELLGIVLKGILAYAPIGVFAISAVAFGNQGWTSLQSLFKFIGVFYLGLCILWLIVYPGFLKLSGTSVVHFFKQTKEAYTTAFFTSSSLATLPIAIESAKKAGISERTANFSLPLGAVFNSDGGALRMGVSIVFAANVTNVHLSLSNLLIITLVGTLLSIGTSGVPAAGLVTLSAVLTMFGLPLEIVALIAGVDAIIGMGGTATNVVGDIVGAAFVDRTERKQPTPIG